MGLSEKHAKILWGRAAGRCTNPGCRQRLTLNSGSGGAEHFGEHAHIIPDRDGPRADAKTDDVDTDSYANHLLLCPTCHTLVDKVDADYPVSLLLKWKADHEAWVDNLLTEAMSRVTFAALQLVCDAIATTQYRDTSLDLSLTPPTEKMARNALSDRLNGAISMGLSQAHVVRDFLGQYEEITPGFPAQLVDGFQREYHAGLAVGLHGDDLFNHLATHTSSDISLQAAQLAIVSYLFHSCDLFEG